MGYSGEGVRIVDDGSGRDGGCAMSGETSTLRNAAASTACPFSRWRRV